jgi:alpha-1,3-rhamnosyltransferase
VKASQGEWIKIIAGDDILESKCIECFIEFCLLNENIKIVESISQFFLETFLKENYLGSQNLGSSFFYSSKTKAEHQYKILLRKNFLHAPSVFIKKEIINEVGGFDESCKFMEDHPMWLKITKKGYKIFFLKKITVFYRIHVSSIYGGINNKKLFNDFYIKRRSLDKKYIYPNISYLESTLKDVEFNRKRIIEKFGFNKNNFFSKLINFATYRISPYNIFVKIKLYFINNQI